MYRDNSLMPKEAVRLAILGMIMQQPMRYADVAVAVRHFTSRLVGPSLDLMAPSLELMRYEGLVEALDGTGMEDNALLGVTPDGRRDFETLMKATVRAPSTDDLNKLVITLKLRFLHLLPEAARREQVELLVELHETELARLEDLRGRHADEPGHLTAWLDHDIGQMRARLAWFEDLAGRV